MQYPIFVQRLIEMARSFGWEQKAIAKRLKVPNSSVSQWSTGARPIPRRHLPAFIALISELIRTYDTTHGAQLNSHLLAWCTELYVRSNAIATHAQTWLKVLKSPYAQDDLLKLTREERSQLRMACVQLVNDLDCLKRFEHGTLPEPSASTETPEARFARFRNWYGLDEAEEDTDGTEA